MFQAQVVCPYLGRLIAKKLSNEKKCLVGAMVYYDIASEKPNEPEVGS
jgi:hypothetical protein